MIRYRRNPVKDYLARVARTIFTPTLSTNGTTPADTIIVIWNFMKVL
jgi:hypothetical protein